MSTRVFKACFTWSQSPHRYDSFPGQQRDGNAVALGEFEKDSAEIDRVVPCFIVGAIKRDDLRVVLIGGLEAGDDVDAGVQDRAWLSLYSSASNG